MPPPFEISLPPRLYEDNPWWIRQVCQKKRRLNVEGAVMCSVLAGAVGGGCQEIFGRSSILPGRLHRRNHRFGVRTRCIVFKKQNFPFFHALMKGSPLLALDVVLARQGPSEPSP